MRGLFWMILGVAILSLAGWAFMTFGFNGAVLLLVSVGLFLLVRGLQGLGVAPGGDAGALANFVNDPADALLDAAIDKAGEWKAQKKAKEPPAFDVNAAFSRYMANRVEVTPDEVTQPVRGFGRKGL